MFCGYYPCDLILLLGLVKAPFYLARKIVSPNIHIVGLKMPVEIKHEKTSMFKDAY